MNSNLAREQRIIDCYTAMATSSSDMLEAATHADWDGVVAGERRCAELVTELKTLGELAPTNERLRNQKKSLIRLILANDAAIRDLAQPRMQQLELKLKGPRNARKLAVAYSATLRPY